MDDELMNIKKGGEMSTIEYDIIKKILKSVPANNRRTGWIIKGINQESRLMKDIDSRSYGYLHGTLKRVYETLKQNNKEITSDQQQGMIDIMTDMGSNEGHQLPLRVAGGSMNGARKKSKKRRSKRRKSKRRKSKKRKTRRRKTKRRS